jgi:DNA repair protein RecN (Recombination protein N)
VANVRSLRVRQFVLADDVNVTFTAGLNVLTGETGAGKSLLVDALTLLTGVRAESDLIRHGADQAQLELELDGGPVETIGRTLRRNGNHVARVDGERVTVQELADTMRQHVRVFAQHAHHELLAESAQRAALDRALPAAARSTLLAYRALWEERSQVQRDLNEARQMAETDAAQRRSLQESIQAIDEVGPSEGEYDRLGEEAGRLRHLDRIVSAAQAAAHALEGEGGASERLGDAARVLKDGAAYDARLARLLEETHDALAAVDAVGRELSDAAFEAFDPRRLEAVEARRAQLERAFLRFGPSETHLLQERERLQSELDKVEHTVGSVAELTAQLASLEARLREHASELHEARLAASSEMAASVTASLQQLAMPNARFTVQVTEGELDAHGASRVRFELAANAGEPAAPLKQAASGGELSRVMLALWLHTGGSADTLVFDEVDAGVGGAAGDAVGRMLHKLARRHQVLVVTHLGPVAAYADRHFHVQKSTADGRTATQVDALTDHERTLELARMLAGHEGAQALAAAQELLERAKNSAHA